MSEVFKWAARYASELGWPIVRNYGMVDGKCMCRAGASCATPGKHPIEKEWMPHATKDEEVIASWFDSGRPWNIGLPMGPVSGIVDTEWDDDESLATAKKFGLLDAKTLGYTSSRGGHRLWILDERLISLPKGVNKVGGLEVRFGGGGKQTQSILPPSLHHTGVRYAWEPGRSPDDVEAARMPESLVLAVVAALSGEAQEGAITKNTIFERVAQKGERHMAMVSWISSEIMRMRDPTDPAEQQNVLLVMRSLNQTQMVEPLPEKEIDSIWRGQLRWGIKARGCGAVNVASTDPNADQKVEQAKKSSVHTLSGLELRGSEWFPGMWRLTVVHSDPKEFRLGVPVVGGGDDEERVQVSLSSAEWSSPIAVARKILEATGTVDVTDPNPKEWAKIWNGYSYKKPGEKTTVRVRGLKVKLMDEKAEEWPPAEQQRFAQVAGWLLDALSNTAPPDPGSDDSSPHPSGKPSWVRGADGEYELYFSWTRVFEDIHKTRKVNMTEGDRLSLKRRILAATGEKEFEARRIKTEAGVKRRYIVWKQSHITHLEDIAHPQDSEP